MIEDLPGIVFRLAVVVLSLAVHEAAHGLSARWLGDDTASRQGRVTLNPLAHLDLQGSVIFPGLVLLSQWLAGGQGSVIFGWAKPVPVDFGNLRQPKRDMLWVAAAGPAANLVMALGWAALAKLAWLLPMNYFSLPMAQMANIGIGINVSLMVLNLLPLPPLDGGRIAVSLLPHRAAWKFAQLERWGFPILLILLFTGILGAVLLPIMAAVMAIIDTIFQLPS